MSNLLVNFRFFSTKIVSNLFTPAKSELFVGRWITPNSNTQKYIDIMIDRNNEDHCGGCEEASVKQNDNQETNILKNDDEYYKAFFM